MATLGAVVKNNRRKKLAVKYAPIRKALRKKSLDTSLTEEERTEAFVGSRSCHAMVHQSEFVIVVL